MTFSAVLSLIFCLKIYLGPFLSDQNSTLVLSLVQAVGKALRSSSVSRRGVVSLAPPASNSATYTVDWKLIFRKASRLPLAVPVGEAKEKPTQLVIRADLSKGLPVWGSKLTCQRFESFALG